MSLGYILDESWIWPNQGTMKNKNYERYCTYLNNISPEPASKTQQVQLKES